MPLLANPRHEAFAQARARGARMEDAYEDAGFVPGDGHAGRLAVRPEGAERIAELRGPQTALEGAGVHAVIAALRRVARAAEGANSPGTRRDVRETLLRIDRLRAEVDERRQADRAWLPRQNFVGKQRVGTEMALRTPSGAPPFPANGSPFPAIFRHFPPNCAMSRPWAAIGRPELASHSPFAAADSPSFPAARGRPGPRTREERPLADVM